MSGGLEWAYDQQNEKELREAKAKFDAVSPSEAKEILLALNRLQNESMTRSGHHQVDEKNRCLVQDKNHPHQLDWQLCPMLCQSE